MFKVNAALKYALPCFYIVPLLYLTFTIRQLTLINLVIISSYLCWLMLSLYFVVKNRTHQISLLFSFLLFHGAMFCAYLALPLLVPSYHPAVRANIVDVLSSYVVHDDQWGKVAELRQDGFDTYPSVGFSLASALNSDRKLPLVPLSGISNKLTVGGAEYESYSVYQSDRYGFNNDNKRYDSPIDAIVIGDSFSHGFGVKQDENVASLLTKNKLNAVTLGTAGNGPYAYYALLREYGKKLKPNYVVWAHCGCNDMNDLRREISGGKLDRYLDDPNYSQNLFEQQDKVDLFWKQSLSGAREISPFWQKFTRTLFGNPQIVQTQILTGSTKFKRPFLPETPIESDLILYRKLLTDSAVRVKKWGGKLLFLYIPSYEELLGHQSKFNESIKSMALESVGNYINLTEGLKRLESPLDAFALRINGHFNKKGNVIFADEIKKAIEIEKNKLKISKK